jgi:hypothetical protein
MVLAFQGLFRSQSTLARQLRIKSSFGISARAIERLASREVAITYREGTLEQLQAWLTSGVPVIVFVQVEELAYWRRESFQHAVVVVQLEESTIWLLDPDWDSTPIAVPLDEFILAWDRMDYLYAAVVVHS